MNFNNEPKSILNQYDYEDKENTRYVRAPYKCKYKPNSALMLNSLFNKALLLYTKIPEQFRTFNIKKFKKEIRSYIREEVPPDRIPKHVDYV